MKDPSKTKQELIEELSVIKQRLQGLEHSESDRKRSEDALRESEEKYRLLVENANEAVYVLQDGNFMYANRICGEMLGVPVAELIGVSMLEFLNPDDKEKAISQHLRILSGELASGWNDFRVLTRHGEERCADVKSVGIVWEGKTATLNFATDITERKRAEEALKESEEKYRAVIEMVSDVIVIIQDGIIRFANPRVKTMLGYETWEIEGMEFVNFIPPDYLGLVLERYQKRMAGEKLSEIYETALLHKSGREVPVESSGSIIEYAGKPADLVSIRDITERKRVEEEKRSMEEHLQRSEKMESLGTLAGGVAHDLNNVLGIIVGYTEMLLDHVDKSSPLRPYIENIMNGGQRAAAIVDDLLTLARRGVLSREVLNLNKIIADCQESPGFEKLTSYNSALKIKTDLEPDLLNISGSSVHLSKTLYNLVSNAIEAMAKGGDVTIRTTNQYLDKPIHGYDQILEGDYVVLTVSDTGEGIPAADISWIFEPFYTKKVMGRSGTGLGLAVVWGTVKDHNGYINVQSEEGKGSTFALYFPVTSKAITSERVAVDISEYMGSGESILVVDDVKEQRDLATAMLRILNYNVSSASGGEEALTYMKEHKADLIVLDMIMNPGMDGLDTYRSILGIYPKQKAIIVSGFSESDRVHDAQALGAGACVRKPYTKENLGLAVKNELKRSARARILIIEDDDQFRPMVRKMLEEGGYNDIEETGKGIAGLKLFKQRPFDLVITDIIMRDKDGIEIITELIRDYPGIKIIAMSGGGRIVPQGYLEMAKILGASRTLEKPFKYSELINAVQELLTK